MGDVDHGALQFPVQAADFGTGLNPQLGIQVREGFIHQKNRWVADDRPTHRDSLPLPAGQLLGFALEEGLNAHLLCRPLYPLLNLALA